jgi:hypothetical protein
MRKLYPHADQAHVQSVYWNLSSPKPILNVNKQTKNIGYMIVTLIKPSDPALKNL